MNAKKLKIKIYSSFIDKNIGVVGFFFPFVDFDPCGNDFKPILDWFRIFI